MAARFQEGTQNISRLRRFALVKLHFQADHATLHNQVVAAASSAGLTPEQVKKIESGELSPWYVGRKSFPPPSRSKQHGDRWVIECILPGG